jgi:tRNA 2-thiouridine synthesizing protein C
MRSIFYLLDAAPYGSEKAFGLLNAAIVSLAKGEVTVGLYGDGVYLALAGQNSKPLGMPNLADLIYAYPDIKVIAHELSLFERGLMGEALIEPIELMDEGDFLQAMKDSEGLVLL